MLIVVLSRIALLLRAKVIANLKFVIMVSFSDLKQVFPSFYRGYQSCIYLLPDHADFCFMTTV